MPKNEIGIIMIYLIATSTLSKPTNFGARAFPLELKSALATLGAVTLAACSPAEANDGNKVREVTVEEVTKVTREQCISLLPDKGEVKACMLKLRAQNKAEIAARTERVEQKISKNDTKTKELDEINTNNEVLSKLIEIAEAETSKGE